MSAATARMKYPTPEAPEEPHNPPMNCPSCRFRGTHTVEGHKVDFYFHFGQGAIQSVFIRDVNGYESSFDRTRFETKKPDFKSAIGWAAWSVYHMYEGK